MGRPEHCAAQVALLLQGLQQVALDDGDWTNATFLVASNDPLGRPEFGAGESEMAAIARYRRGLRDLKKKFVAKSEAQSGRATGARAASAARRRSETPRCCETLRFYL